MITGVFPYPGTPFFNHQQDPVPAHQESPGLKDKKTRTREHPSGKPDPEKRGYFLLVNTEAINDEPVFYKYITPQAKAFDNFYV